VLLARHTAQDDLLIGTPIANRDRAETDRLIGLLLNTLVLRARLDDDPTFAELLARTRSGALAGFAHQDMPFEQLVDDLVRDRDPSRTPLVQALFNYIVAGDSPGLELHDRDGVIAKFDLRLVLMESGDRLVGGFEYATALFDADRIHRMTGHLLTLLEAVVADVDLPVSQLPLGVEPPATTHAEVPAIGGVHELITTRDDTPAVDDLTYRDLHARANRLAHHLKSLGAGPDTVIAICFDNPADTITAILGVWKAGAAYLPLDPSHPHDRITYQLRHSNTTLIHTTDDILEDLPAGRIRTLTTSDPFLAVHPNTDPDVTVHPDQAAYLIYTSGTTGRPKGVVITHRALTNYATVAPARLGLGEPGDTYGLITPATTDFGNTIILAALTTGGTIRTPEPGTITNPVAMAAFVPTVDHLKIVPSHLASLWPLPLPRKTLILGGEATPADLARELGGTVVNHYGPTETTIGVLTHTSPDALGTPLPNITAHILDDHLQPVPVGVPGHLHISGPQLARGYHNNPVHTAEQFIPSAGGERLYRTGDLARYNTDGTIAYLGRTDHQIKIRGHRIEPGEVQLTLTNHPAVAHAVVTEHDGRLIAYLVPNGELPGGEQLRDYLRRTLPEHMVPSAFLPLDALPLTANGKLDRRALPEPGSERPELVTGFQGADTPTEQALVEIWADLLKLDRIGVTDNFFDLGGHSLLVTQVVTRIRQRFGVSVGVGTFFNQPTVREIAENVEEAILAEIEEMSETEALRELGDADPEDPR
jgi:amino acid adenylation domain-containing protein